MIPPIAAFRAPDALARPAGETLDHGGTDGTMAGAFKQRLRPVCIDLRLIADHLEAGDAFGERRVVQIGNACLYGVVEALQAQVRFGRPALQFGDVLAAALGLIGAAAENAAKQLLQPVGIEQAFFDMADHHVVELVHGDRPALAAGFTLPRLDRAGIVAIAAALAGADGHGPAALLAKADAGQQGRPDHDAGGQFGLGIAGL